MTKELQVPIHLIVETTSHPTYVDLLVAHLDNGMSTDIFIKSNGQVVAKTEDACVIDYLIKNKRWNGYNETALLSNDLLCIRPFEEEKDLDRLAKLDMEIVDDIFSNDIIDQISKRATKMVMNRSEDYGANIFIVEYRDEIIGKIIYQNKGEVMRLNFKFNLISNLEVQEATKAIKLVMRRLIATFDFNQFLFDKTDVDQIALINELGIEYKDHDYHLSRRDFTKYIQHFLQ